MLKTRISLVALAMIAATQAQANEQAESKGFIEDSHANVLLRNAFINRDKKHGTNDQSQWGQGVIANFSSGFTQGTVGVGVDAFGLYALRLDGGKGRNGGGGIDFFKRENTVNERERSDAANDLARAGAAIKFRVSNTVLKYGDQMPALPVLQYDDSRLLPESFSGTSITSKEIKGLELNAGRFTSEVQKSAQGHDSGRLKAINVLGGSYKFTDNFTASLYTADNEDVMKKHYLGMNYVYPIAADQSLTLDFNGYKSKLDKKFIEKWGMREGDQDNTIWSLAATYAYGPHSVTIAHQRSTGDTGYNYGGYQRDGGFGDGGSTIYLANSYWSDFNAEDERSWQIGYGLDFGAFGVPGLTYKVAYVRGDNINTHGNGEGKEREIFNQLRYVVQEGPAKDLSVKLRSSFLRTSRNVADFYMDDGNEVRVFVEYPISIF
ncbi:OprD family porin [Pseudomonas mosselii]|uniref:OprD family porin n=1 Tax=Pseudomonas mosselii TaxID=78327 RepID=UPI00076FE9FA|nr:OprD family porin [Pseudomonas mosselii]AMK33435.1 Outer membrane porin [Pseudomonas putida]MBC3450773.1 OprD family porin [Pseudomonas mosselii]MDH1658252.1 OprD family porin [Pseudomonas mosselii]MDH1716306.1 OprD family porin [Pseudomonas mosselii]MDH1720339.1 OprD family porin [Pseudomonas mosselii]